MRSTSAWRNSLWPSSSSAPTTTMAAWPDEGSEKSSVASMRMRVVSTPRLQPGEPERHFDGDTSPSDTQAIDSGGTASP